MSITVQSISARELAEWLADSHRTPPLLLDVREPREVETAHVEQARCIPMHQVPHKCESFDPASDIVVMCHHGARSMRVAMYLVQNGFARVYNLSGGIDAWSRDVDPAVPTY